MCIDATDPDKGNWLRYVNWACSGEEQNLFPLEINRAIYYKTLKVRAERVELTCWCASYSVPLLFGGMTHSNASADLESFVTALKGRVLNTCCHPRV
ncbi:PR domain zinc finger protein 2 [Galemys pyrenaicus]|uniref:PR domain zinc finger protein 2 n=1 Tax=Galemys pyrenaicus TaxID=202257 RepID=A0A8J5ZQE8_GALPY|nr:PR domain zinc finger protein 2 [Galemys pyrenaicus]